MNLVSGSYKIVVKRLSLEGRACITQGMFGKPIYLAKDSNGTAFLWQGKPEVDDAGDYWSTIDRLSNKSTSQLIGSVSTKYPSRLTGCIKLHHSQMRLLEEITHE